MSTDIPSRSASPSNSHVSVSLDSSDPSCFDMLDLLRRRLFLSREQLVPRVVTASKDDQGLIDWVDFDKSFHSHLLGRVKAITGSLTNGARKALFVFVLEVLNGEDFSAFFDLKKGASQRQHLDREKKRLQRKRACAAKRERQRHAIRAVNEVARSQREHYLLNQ